MNNMLKFCQNCSKAEFYLFNFEPYVLNKNTFSKPYLALWHIQTYFAIFHQYPRSLSSHITDNTFYNDFSRTNS